MITRVSAIIDIPAALSTRAGSGGGTTASRRALCAGERQRESDRHAKLLAALRGPPLSETCASPFHPFRAAQPSRRGPTKRRAPAGVMASKKRSRDAESIPGVEEALADLSATLERGAESKLRVRSSQGAWGPAPGPLQPLQRSQACPGCPGSSCAMCERARRRSPTRRRSPLGPAPSASLGPRPRPWTASSRWWTPLMTRTRRSAPWWVLTPRFTSQSCWPTRVWRRAPRRPSPRSSSTGEERAAEEAAGRRSRLPACGCRPGLAQRLGSAHARPRALLVPSSPPHKME